MIQTIDAPISVTLDFNHRSRQVKPISLNWEGREYTVASVGYHHHFYQGKILIHVFSVITSTLFFRLVFNTQTLHWRVEQVSDDEVN